MYIAERLINRKSDYIKTFNIIVRLKVKIDWLGLFVLKPETLDKS